MADTPRDKDDAKGRVKDAADKTADKVKDVFRKD